jgi:hypothetical protein
VTVLKDLLIVEVFVKGQDIFPIRKYHNSFINHSDIILWSDIIYQMTYIMYNDLVMNVEKNKLICYILFWKGFLNFVGKKHFVYF